MRATWDKRLRATIRIIEDGSQRTLETTAVTWTDLP